MKKFISLLLIVSLAFTCGVTTFAQEKNNADLFELKGLGIITEEKTLDEEIHRGEFAQLVVALLDMTDLAQQQDPTDRYSDVPITAEYAKSVALLSRLGILNGTGDGKFEPEEGIYLEQAVKVLVYCAGYDLLAGQMGGWPNGYLAVGANIGLLRNVDSNEPLTRADVYRLLTNALDVELLVHNYGKPENTIVRSGNTFREILMNKNSDEEIFCLSGVVEANSYSYIGSPVSDLKDSEVVINSVVYNIGNTNAAEFFGQNIDFFAAKTANGYTLISVQPANKQNILKIDADDFFAKTQDVIYYSGENEKEKKAVLTEFPKVVYNGTRVLYPDDDLYRISNGTITLIDHDGDNLFDVLLLDEYENVVAKKYADGLFQFRNDCFYRGKNTLYIDLNNDAKKLLITDAEGQQIEAFDEDKVLSIFADLGGTRYKIVVSDKTVEGKLESFSEDEIVIDGIAYNYDKNRNFREMLGKTGTFYLNFNGELAFSASIDTPQYGYILGIDRDGTLGPLRVRMLAAGQVDFGIDVNAEDVNDTSQIPYLISQNSGISALEFAQKVTFDGSTYRDNLDTISSRLLNQAVKYKLNEEGKINSIELAEKFGGDDTLRSKYNVYEMVFGGSEYLNGFAINSDTRVICVPNNTTNNDDCMVKVKIDIANNATGYLVTGHDFDETTKKAKLLVIRSEMDSSQVRPVNLMSSRASMVQSVFRQFNNESEESETIVEILTDNTVHTLKVLDSFNASSLKVGDVIAYLTNANDVLENVMVFESVDSISGDMRVTRSDNYISTYGSVKEMSYDDVDSLNNVLITNLTLEANGVEYLFRIPQRNKPSIYLYHKRTQEVENAALDEIIPGADELYILERAGDSLIRAIVIVR